MKTIKSIFAAAAVVTLIAGCASNGYRQAGATAGSLQNTSDRINRGTTQIDAALAALSQLVDNPSADLKLQFKNFNTAVSGVDAFARDLASRNVSIQQQGATYFQKWDEELATIQNEDIRSRSAERKVEVMKQFDRVKANYDETRTQLNPFLADLRDIRTAIGTDLTPAGLENIRSTAGKVNARGVAVRQSLADLAVEFKNLATSLATPTPAAASATAPAK
jgi:hypothetical protein